jgi:hypothetical protein
MSIKYQNGITRNVRLLFCLLTAGFLLSNLGSVRAQSSNAEKIKETLKVMKEEAVKLGEPKLDGGNLFFGTTKINGNYTIVDSLKSRFSCVSTFFAKKNTGYVRVSTNVLNEGDRAVGTVLDPNGAAYAAISKGEAFYGTVDILGKKYESGYEPIKNAAGEIVGVYFVGFAAQ